MYCYLLSECGVLTDGGQLGQEANVVLQICSRCLQPNGSHPPAITSAFARTSIPGYVFVEAYHVGEVIHAVDGLVAVRDKKLNFIAPTEYVGLLSRDFLSSSRVEVGQWMCCLVGQYRNDLGYIFDMDEGNTTVAFVPISKMSSVLNSLIALFCLFFPFFFTFFKTVS